MRDYKGFKIPEIIVDESGKAILEDIGIKYMNIHYGSNIFEPEIEVELKNPDRNGSIKFGYNVLNDLMFLECREANESLKNTIAKLIDDYYRKNVDHIQHTREIKVGYVYRHFKGKLVLVKDIANHTEEEEELVIYKDLSDGTIWARPYYIFISEVDHSKYPEITQKYRFEEVERFSRKDDRAMYGKVVIPPNVVVPDETLKSFKHYKYQTPIEPNSEPVELPKINQ